MSEETAVADPVEVSADVKKVLESATGLGGDLNVLILELIKTMTGKQLVDAVKLVEDQLGIKAASGGGGGMVMMAAADDGGGGEDAGPKSYDVHMESFGEKKIQVIKAIRSLTGLGLKEAKAMVDGAPCMVKEGLEEEEANKYKTELEAAGASIELK